MKKQLLLFLFILAGTSSYAQIGAGTILAGGDLAYSRQSNETKNSSGYNNKGTYSVFAANPKVGYFIAPNLAIGTGISFAKYTDETKVSAAGMQASKSSMRSVGFSPFGRYYKMLGERAGFFGQLTGTFSQSTINTFEETEYKFNTASLVVAPGFVFFATPRIGIETTIGQLGYFHSKSKYNANVLESTTNGFEAGVNASNLFFGINYYFGR